MFIPFDVTLNDSENPDIYKQLEKETIERIQAIKELREALDRGETFDMIDPDTITEIKNLDMEHVHCNLGYNENGKLWLHLW